MIAIGRSRMIETQAQPLRQDQRLHHRHHHADQVASSAPTDRSMLRVTITNTMPVAMIRDRRRSGSSG